MRTSTVNAPTNTIKQNKGKCLKCGDIIESKHRHDFVTCSCEACSVDGGTAYLRRSGNPGDFEELSTYVNEKPATVKDMKKVDF